MTPRPASCAPCSRPGGWCIYNCPWSWSILYTLGLPHIKRLWKFKMHKNQSAIWQKKTQMHWIFSDKIFKVNPKFLKMGSDVTMTSLKTLENNVYQTEWSIYLLKGCCLSGWTVHSSFDFQTVTMLRCFLKVWKMPSNGMNYNFGKRRLNTFSRKCLLCILSHIIQTADYSAIFCQFIEAQMLMVVTSQMRIHACNTRGKI